MRKQAEPQQVAAYGIDIGKSVFHVAGLDAAGRPVLRKKFKRDRILTFFSNVPVSVTAMEACPGSQWLARKLKGYGHDARILPAQFVKPYVKSNKNDNVDAEAIAEAAMSAVAASGPMPGIVCRRRAISSRSARHSVNGETVTSGACSSMARDRASCTWTDQETG